jgi:hypothetical protein
VIFSSDFSGLPYLSDLPTCFWEIRVETRGDLCFRLKTEGLQYKDCSIEITEEMIATGGSELVVDLGGRVSCRGRSQRDVARGAHTEPLGLSSPAILVWLFGEPGYPFRANAGLRGCPCTYPHKSR